MRQKDTRRNQNLIPVIHFVKPTLWTIGLVSSLSLIADFYHPRWIFDWEGIRPDIRDSVLFLDKYNRITSGGVGIAAKTPKQWYTRLWILRNANVGELESLKKYPGEAVKATAYEGLLRKDSCDNFSLLLEALQDTSSFVHYQSGCLGEAFMLGEYLLGKVMSVVISDNAPPPPPPIASPAVHYNLTEQQLDTLIQIGKDRLSKKWEYHSLSR